MFTRFGTINRRDRRMDRRTSRDGIDRAMHSVAWQKRSDINVQG